mmetsp:Transcript_20010/g.25786  ORF Transcript_20010/g.25786 Transcript_20010/m.25786 type:complete len:355 (+) Transcript_20010:142-1206(+)|eukprot:CAMPEP_0198142086 /NCGR_PEP_ID=MMETSP1443-20131203/4975_1 /TAXON_ID=186043 /ORGANISM="Entomoneis sp., Strain CCMP2396" /LENGTH=354 /DNA_ID=CAMNT_0043805033 /DNA_START=118 /DNA_END=1182 /DNA_ORIENTATION=+
MSHALGSKLDFQPGSWLEAGYEVFIGTVVGVYHFIYIVSKWWYVNLLTPVFGLFGVKLLKDKVVESRSGEKTLKVVAVGYGRTGTYSLTLALEELGFPTLHTQHMYEHESILGMWVDEIFLPSIAAKKTSMGRPNLQMIVDYGYQATADLPMALYFEQVMEEYPDCKFILTTRENSEVWFKSWNTLTQSITQPTHVGGFAFDSVRQYSHYLRWLYSVVNKDEKFLSVPFPLPAQHKETAIESYEEHNRRVRELVPEEMLLEYSVKDGWEPLCKFMEIDDCPDTTFPKTNSARSVQVQVISGQIFPVVLSLLVIFYAFALAFRRFTGKTVVDWAKLKSKELSYSVNSEAKYVKQA